jgi:phosphoglycerol transferase
MKFHLRVSKKTLYSLTALTALVAISIWASFFARGHVSLEQLQKPMIYNADGIAGHVLVKTLIQGDWNPFLVPQSSSLGAPSAYELYDYPVNERFGFLSWWAIGLFTKNPFLVFNLYFFISYFLCAYSFFWLCRKYRMSQEVSVLASLFFSFLAFHYIRVIHVFMANYFLVPIMIFYAHRILHLQSLEAFFKSKRKILIFIFIHLLFSINSIYFCFFYCSLLGFGLLLKIRSVISNPKKLVLPAISILLLVAFVSLNFIPNLQYMRAHGKNPTAVERNNSEAEFYALKPANILLPNEWHNLSLFRHIKEKYVPTYKAEGYNEYIGLVGVLGLLLIIYFSLAKRPVFVVKKYFNHILILFALGITGGLGALLTNYLLPPFRCYNRVSIFIATISIFCFFLLFDRWLKNKSKVSKRAFYGLCLLLFSIDSLPKNMKIDLGPSQMYVTDQKFFESAESLIPDTSQILQLPYIPFPEFPVQFEMEDYDHFKAFLASSKNYKFSYGAMKGRPGADLIQKISKFPLDKALLLENGFNTVLVNSDGFDPQQRKDVLKQISNLLGQPLLVGGWNQRWYLFKVK